MSDTNELDLDGGESSDLDTKAKKTSGLAALLPNLLKFVAIGLGALIFIVTVSVITFNILNKRGAAQSPIPANSPYARSRPQYMYSTVIGVVRTQTKDTVAVVVNVMLGYNENDNAAQTEITNRQYEVRDYLRSYFRSKTAEELRPENEEKIKLEIVEHLNQQVFSTTRVQKITFDQFDVMGL